MSPTVFKPSLEVIWDSPPIQDFSHPYITKYNPGPNSRLVIYGAHELVERLVTAMQDELEAIRREINS